MDLLALLERLMANFGQVANQRRTTCVRIRYRVTIIWSWLDLAYALWLACFVSDEQILTTFGAVGYALYGKPYKWLGETLMVFYRIHATLMFTTTVLDNNHWLREANSLFHRATPWLRIRPSRLDTVRRITYLAYATLAFYYNTVNGMTLALIYLGAIAFHPIGFFVAGITYMIHVFHLAYFLSQFALLTLLSIDFVHQYRLRLRVAMNYNPKQFRQTIRDFFPLFLLLKKMQVYLRRSFLLMVMQMFGTGIALYYGSFFAHFRFVHLRIICMCYCTIVTSVVNFFAFLSGKPDKEAKKVSRKVYRAVVVAPAKGKRVRINHFRHYQLLIRFFEVIDADTVGLKILNTPINLLTTVQSVLTSATKQSRDQTFEPLCQPMSSNSQSQQTHEPLYKALCISNCFCCDGCVWAPQESPDSFTYYPNKKSNYKQIKNSTFAYINLLLLLLFFGLFLFFDAKFLAENIHVTVPVISALIFVFVLGALFTTACTDPGIIPPCLGDEALWLQREMSNMINPYQMGIMKTQHVEVHGQRFHLKYCYTCRLMRPPRSSHCSICNHCIDRFDHHCPWIGNCIGRRNYRSFYLYLIFLNSLLIYVSSCEIVHLVLLTQGHKRPLYLMVHNALGTLICLFLFLMTLWFILGLTGFHTYLLLTNTTTNEEIKETFVSKTLGPPRFVENPYTTGSASGNCNVTMCHARTASLLHHHVGD